jgi:hypothetical protein
MSNNLHQSITVADIFRQGLDRYLSRYNTLSAKAWKVVNNILNCRTAALGGHIYKCDNCDTVIISYNSCRDRHCPMCQSTARALWVQKRINELLPVGYFHTVFTIPDSFNAFALRNKKVVYTILFKSVSETLLTLGNDPQRLGAAIGFIAVLHTWGQNLMDHPHIHCIIPGGGITDNGKKWKSSRKDFLFPDKVIASLFKKKFLDYFKKAVETKQIELHGTLKKYEDVIYYRDFLSSQYKKEWVVYSKKPFSSTENVIKYIGRYTHRIAISNQRIIGIKDNKVSFWWKDYRDNEKQKIMILDLEEFIRRFLLHILPDGYVRIRYFGILSNGKRAENIKRCLKLFEKDPEEHQYPTDTLSILRIIFGVDATLCPNCKNGHSYHLKEILKEPKSKLSLAA